LPRVSREKKNTLALFVKQALLSGIVDGTILTKAARQTMLLPKEIVSFKKEVRQVLGQLKMQGIDVNAQIETGQANVGTVLAKRAFAVRPETMQKMQELNSHFEKMKLAYPPYFKD